jgi:tetratricopeptide (TPR) repeat protein
MVSSGYIEPWRTPMKAGSRSNLKFLFYGPAVLLLLIAISGCTPVINLTNDGERYLMVGDYEKAIDAYNRAIALDPRASEAYLGRGTAYEELGEFHKALDDYNSAVAITPNDAGVYIIRGLVYELLGNYDMALQNYSTSIQINPNNANAYFHRGNACMNLGNVAQAFESYKDAARRGHTESQNLLHSKGIAW